jgi:hypothetical protein
MREAGVRRLSEVLMLVDGWDASTVQGFTWGASPLGLSSYSRPGWAVMLDGQVVDLVQFGVRSLERVPVTIGQIDSVTVTTTPRLHDGAFVQSGVIHFHTRRPRRGLSARAHATTANETGDPGPYRHTELSTPNIDRIGSGVSGSASYSTGRAFLEAGALWQEHFVTNPRIRQRNYDISVDEYPIIKQSAASLRGGLRLGSTQHSLYLGRSSTRDYYFLKQYGREVPVESPFTQLGIDGTLRLPGATALSYRAAYSVNELDEHANTLDLDYDWKLSRSRVDLEASRRSSSYSARLGAGVEHAAAQTSYSLSDDDFTLFKIYSELGYRLGDANDGALTVHLTATDELAWKAVLYHRWRPGPRHALEASLSYLERLPEEDGRIWYWHRRGYRFLPDNGVPVVIEGEPGTARTTALDLGWTGWLGNRLRAKLGGYFRSFSGLSLEDQPFQFDSLSGVFSGPVRLAASQSGEIGGAEVRADWEALTALEIAAYYRYQDVISGDDLFQNAWRTVPKHVLRISALYTPWPSVDLWGALRYRSSTRWADYRDAEEQTNGEYSSTVEEATAIDLGAQKWFWHRQARLHLQLRNILNLDVPHHPIGAAYGFTFIVQAEFLLEGL